MRKLMMVVIAMAVIAVAVELSILMSKKPQRKCTYGAIFMLGDSYSDTGGYFNAFPGIIPSFPAQLQPFGMTFFKRPNGRPTDGRLFIDFLTEEFGFPYLDPFLQSTAPDFRHGANFTTSASTVFRANTSIFTTGTCPCNLKAQVNQMVYLKERVDQLRTPVPENFPKRETFGESLYTIYIGQNDYARKLLEVGGIEEVKSFMPDLIGNITGRVKELYEKVGGRTFLVINFAPIGCYPAFLASSPRNHSEFKIGANGCLISITNAVNEYNKMLKRSVSVIRQQLANATVVYFDSNSVLMDMIQHPTSYGMKYGKKSCCGYGGGDYNFDRRVLCGNSGVVYGKRVYPTVCSDPENYVIFDGIHVTEAANRIMASAIQNGSYSDPPFPIRQSCS